MFLCRTLASKFATHPMPPPARVFGTGVSDLDPPTRRQQVVCGPSRRDRPSCESPCQPDHGRDAVRITQEVVRSGRGGGEDRFAFGLPVGLEADGGARVGAGVDDREQEKALVSRWLPPGSSRWRSRGPLETGIGRPREPALVGLDQPEALRHLFLTLGGVVAGDGEEWQRALVGPGRLGEEQYSERESMKPSARTIQMQSGVRLHG